MAVNYTNLNDGLATLDEFTGEPPETRMKDPMHVRDMVTRAIQLDSNERDWKRSRLKGQVDGNPPFSASALRAAGRADDCNVNWRIAKYFLTLAQGMIYDVFSEAPTYTTVTLDYQKVIDEVLKQDAFSGISADQVCEWGNAITEEFDRLQKGDPDWDFTCQQSQGQSVFYGCGPMLFEDTLDWRPWSVECRALLVPEWAKSNTNKWEWCAAIVEYTPDKLFQHIMHPPTAQSAGWNVPATRRSIMGAHTLTRTGAAYQNWSWHQDLLKNGTLYYADSSQSKMIRTAHFYFREFPEGNEESGKITECIVDLDNAETTNGGQVEFLFRKVRKYDSWRQVVHPMYWQNDVNGYHHSVTGIGIEMYGALEIENRVLCDQVNDLRSPKMFFKPTTASERERMSIAQIGRYGILPAALEMVQQHIQPFMQDGIAMSREIQSIVSSNLSQFRSNALTKQQGNPVTARQIDYEASEQAKMGKTQLSRIYEQYDWVYEEKYRRATNPNLTKQIRGGKEAIEFQERCKKRGIPPEALRSTASVKATRVVGQGSSFMRQQALEFLLGLVTMLPESGRSNLVKQVIASRAGQSKVAEFYPEPAQDISAQAQQSDAVQQVAAMKVGVPPVMVPTQNPMIYAAIFLQAADAAMQSVQQGGNPAEAVGFLDLAIPATAQHIARMSQDKTRADSVKEMSAKLKELDQFNEQLKEQMAQAQQEQAQQQAEMQQIQSGMSPETQIGLAKVEAKRQIDMTKLAANMDLKAQKQQGDFALAGTRLAADTQLADLDTAASIRRKDAEARAKAARPSGNGKPK